MVERAQFAGAHTPGVRYRNRLSLSRDKAIGKVSGCTEGAGQTASERYFGAGAPAAMLCARVGLAGGIGVA